MEEKPSLEDLAHYGVKGMHWGVQKARTGDVARETAVLDRVASGKGSALDKVHALAGSSALRLVKSGGLKNESARRSESLKAHSERLATGHAKVSDILAAYGTVSLLSLVRSVKD